MSRTEYQVKRGSTHAFFIGSMFKKTGHPPLQWSSHYYLAIHSVFAASAVLPSPVGVQLRRSSMVNIQWSMVKGQLKWSMVIHFQNACTYCTPTGNFKLTHHHQKCLPQLSLIFWRLTFPSPPSSSQSQYFSLRLHLFRNTTWQFGVHTVWAHNLRLYNAQN